MRWFSIVCIFIVLVIGLIYYSLYGPPSQANLPDDMIPFEDDYLVTVTFDQPDQLYNGIMISPKADDSNGRIGLIYRSVKNFNLPRYEFHYLHLTGYRGSQGIGVADSSLVLKPGEAVLRLPDLNENPINYTILILLKDGPWHVLKEVSPGDEITSLHIPGLDELQLYASEKKSK